jgi:hypothetical protein
MALITGLVTVFGLWTTYLQNRNKSITDKINEELAANTAMTAKTHAILKEACPADAALVEAKIGGADRAL